MSGQQQADLILWIGAFGLLEFGSLLAAVKVGGRFSVDPSGQVPATSLCSASRWRRAHQAARIAPMMIAVSVASIAAGAILRWPLF